MSSDLVHYENLPLEDALEECRAHPDDVYVGFTGGEERLRRAGRAHAHAKKWWKVRNARTNAGRLELTGPPFEKNWIKGDRFLELITRLG